MKTYEIIGMLRKIADMRTAVNEETGEFLYSDEDIEKAEKEIRATKEEKLNAIQDYKLSLNGDIALYEAKNKKQEDNIKRVKKQQDYLKELQMDLLDGEKLKTDEYTFYYTTSKSVNITDEKRIFERGAYIRTTLTPDKTAIKKALLGGDKVLGAELVTNTSLVVK